MRNVVYAKTGAGKGELLQRGKVPQRLRTLLVMIDGHIPSGQRLGSMKGLGITEESFAEPEKLGLIEAATPTTPAASAAVAPPAVAPASGNRERLRELHSFFNETLREVLGLRGFTFQLKVEKASTLEDFRALREPCLTAIHKSKGELIANAFASRLDALLG